MIRFDLQDAAVRVGGRLVAPEPGPMADSFTGMTHDTRDLAVGNLYAALAGARVDGHDLVGEAAAAGAAAALVSRQVTAPIAQIVVGDVVGAMGELARAWRETLPCTVIGVTGSNGKTTVKTMLAGILGRTAPTLATQGNYNNEIGVPLTLAGLEAGHRWAVVEMGCGQPGDIAYLARLARPQVGLVTNAGPAHLERLGSVEGVARTKGELFAALDDDGIAVINRDDEYFGYWCELCPDRRRITFGRHAGAAVRLTYDDGREWVDTPDGRFELKLALPGLHNRLNALAATAAALAVDVDPDTIAAGLSGVEAVPGRLSAHAMPDGWTLIDDTYNANPGSLYAAMQVLAQRPGRRWLVLGDMAELGEQAASLHREIGRAAREMGVDRLLALGEHARLAAEDFGPGGEAFESLDTLAAELIAALQPGVTCLVKGSRSMHMERLVERLRSGEVRTAC